MGEPCKASCRQSALGGPDPLQDAMAEIERLRESVLAIQRATVEGRICDDVAWFDTITTLHDYCDQTLNPRL